MPNEFQQSLHFMKQVGFRSEAYINGDDWVRSQLANLKIDLWLATEHGEPEEGSAQMDQIHRKINILNNVLQKSIFDPDPTKLSGSLAIEAAAADLGQYVLQLANKNREDFGATLSAAVQILYGNEARQLASECMERVSACRGIIHDDVGAVIQCALHLLSCCKK